MARVRVTVPVYGLYGGYPHREHRSKKGRKKRVIGEDKLATYFARAKKDEKRLKKNDIMVADPLVEEEEKIEFKETLTLGDVLELPLPAKKKPETFPKLVCENCGYHNQLNFAPKKDYGRLAEVICQNCKELAYYSYYWKDFEVRSVRLFMNQVYTRDLIKQGMTLLILRNVW